MKKKLLGFIALAICSFGLVVSVNAAEEYPEVKNVTKEDTLPASVPINVEGSKTDLVTVTVNAGEWHLLDDSVLNRPDGYAWVGLEFTMPSGSTNAKISGDNEDFGTSPVITEYFGFKLEDITQAVDELKPNLTKDFTLTWEDSEGKDYQQKIHLVVEFAKISLKDESKNIGDHSTSVWNEDIYTETKEVAETSHTHKITIVTEHGKVAAPTTALIGTEVILKITADKGYELDKIVVDDETVKVVDNKFTMPDKDVKITVTFKEVKTETDTEVDTETVVKPDTEVNENPSTFDGVVAYMILGTLALGSTLYVSNKICKKEN